MPLYCKWISFGNTDLNRLTHFLYGAQKQELGCYRTAILRYTLATWLIFLTQTGKETY